MKAAAPVPAMAPGTARRPLPDGWRWVRLCDVATINPRRPQGFSRDPDAPTTFVPMSAVDAVRGVIAEAETKPFADVAKGYTFFLEGDVLFAKITPCMQNGKHVVARNLLDGVGFASTEFHVIRAGADVLPEWIHGFVRQPTILLEATNHFTGAVGQQRVPDGFLSDLVMPIPPIPEQERIVATLREQMAAVEKARAAAQARREAAMALPASFLRRVFPHHGQTLPKGWSWVRLGETASVQGGYAFKSEWFVPDGIRLLRNANIFQGYIAWEDVVYISRESRSQFPGYELRENDIVLSLDRPIVSSGLKIARLTSADTPSLLLQRVGRYRLRSNIIPEYLYAYLNSSAFIHEITRHDYSLGVPHVSPTQVESIQMPLPPIAEQRRLASSLTAFTESASAASEAAIAELHAIVALPAALLRRAFKGDL